MAETPALRHLGSATACLSLAAFAVSAALLPAVLPRAAASLGVEAGTLSWVLATQFSACCAAAVAGGILADRHGMRPVLLGGALALAGGAALWSVAGGLGTAHLAAGLMGAGGGVLEALGSALLAALHPGRRRMVLNLSQAAYCAGAVAGPAAVGLLLPMGTDWRGFFAAETGLGLLLLALYRLAPMPAGGADGAGLGSILRGLGGTRVLLPALALFAYVLAESGIAFYLNLHLQERHGAPERWAVFGLSAFWGAMLAGRLACALLPDGLPALRVITLPAAAAALAVGAQALAGGWVPSLALFAAAGLLAAGIWPAIVALAAALNPGRGGSAVGTVVAVGSLGVVAAPLARQLAPDGAFFPAMAALLLAAGLVLLPLRSPKGPP